LIFAGGSDNARVRKLAQPLREKRARHQRNAALQVVEAPAAEQQFTKQERRPSAANDLSGFGNWTELAVSTHRCSPRAPVTLSNTLHVPEYDWL
jgi:hypothetical protein